MLKWGSQGMPACVEGCNNGMILEKESWKRVLLPVRDRIREDRETTAGVLGKAEDETWGIGQEE